MALARATTHTTSADGTFSSAGAAAWNADHANTITGATSGGIPYFDSTTTEATSALLAQYGVVIGGGAGAAPATNSGLTFGGASAGAGLAIAAGTATTDVAALSLTRTNNNAAVATGVKLTFTDTSSAAGFLPFQILGGSGATTNLLSVGKGGVITAPSFAATAAGGIGFTGGSTGAVAADSNGMNIIEVTNLPILFATNNTTWATITTTGDAKLTSSSMFNWGSGNYASAADTGLSRISAGLVGVGTGAAGSFAGSLKLTTLTLDGLAMLKGYAVASLPAGVDGAIAIVTDQLTTVAAKGVAPTGGGSVHCAVIYNGSAWVGI